MPTMSPYVYALGALGLAFALFAWDVNGEIEGLNERIDKLGSDKAQLQLQVGSLESQKFTLKQSIVEQNLAIEAIRVEYDESLAEYRNMPATVRYETITKYIGVQSNECNDTQDIINTIRNTSYSEL